MTGKFARPCGEQKENVTPDNNKNDRRERLRGGMTKSLRNSNVAEN